VTYAVLDRLKKQASAAKEHLSAEQVRNAVDGITAGDARDEVAVKAGISTNAVMDLVASFGSFLGRTRRGKNKVEATEGAQIADGFERRTDENGRRRNVSASYWRIRGAQASDEEIVRWLSREYPAPGVLDFRTVSTVAFIARLKDANGNSRLDELDQINPASPDLARRLSMAVNMLEVARADAMAALDVLISAGERRDMVASDIDILLMAVAKVTWVNPGRIGEMQRAFTNAKAALAKDDARGESYIMNGVRSRCWNLAREIQSGEGWRFETIADLRDGHVRTIAQNAGMNVDPESRSERTKLRDDLTERGLGSDLDKLVPLGQRAMAAGVTDVFWKAIDDRVTGDANWDVELRAALADGEEFGATATASAFGDDVSEIDRLLLEQSMDDADGYTQDEELTSSYDEMAFAV
jgi:hypothetical protein